MSKYIEKVVNDFFEQLDKAYKDLGSFTNDIEQTEDKIFKALDNLTKINKQNSENLILKQNINDEIQEKLGRTLTGFHSMVKNWSQQIANNKKGQEFINENEKQMLVMVFGQVKTGKSSLGNFLAGKHFIKAPFDNEYINRYQEISTKPIFIIEKSGRDGNMRGEWFAEGETDTTGAIQHFTLSGLRWVDSPGTGAVSKKGDTLDMEELVQEYLKYTDLGVFLMSSDEPGLQPDFNYIKKLQNYGKPAIILITKSDYNEEDIDPVTNKFVANWVAKDANNRSEQEDWISSELQKMGIADKFSVLSISTYLATRGIAEKSESLFRQSNLDKFMNLLGKTIGTQSIELKKRNPKENINRLIREIIYGLEPDNKQKGFSGVQDLQKQFERIKMAINESKKKIKLLEGTLYSSISAKVKAQVHTKLDDLSQSIQNSGGSVSGKEISNIVAEILQVVTVHELDNAISDVLNSFDKSQVNINVNFNINVELKKEVEQIEQRNYYTVSEERVAEGFFENIGKFFGKKYYRVKEEVDIWYHTIELGTNLYKVVGDVMQVVEEQTQITVSNELQNLIVKYFTPYETYIQDTEKRLQYFVVELEALQYKI